LLITGVIALIAGGLALYGRHAVLDQDAFAARATSALAQDEVKDEVAERITRREVEANPALAARRPVLEAAVADLVEGMAFPDEFRNGVMTMHASLFDRHGPAITGAWGGDARTAKLPLPGAAAELRGALALRSPAAARELPEADPVLLALGGGRLESSLVDAAPIARRATALAPLLVLAGLALLAWAARRAPTRRHGLRRLALVNAVARCASFPATSIVLAIVLSTSDSSLGDAVVGTIWSAFLADLRLWGLGVGALGLIAAAAFEPGAPGAWRRATAAESSVEPSSTTMTSSGLRVCAQTLCKASSR
jgi:hypothetical protein